MYKKDEDEYEVMYIQNEGTYDMISISKKNDKFPHEVVDNEDMEHTKIQTKEKNMHSYVKFM